MYRLITRCTAILNLHQLLLIIRLIINLKFIRPCPSHKVIRVSLIVLHQLIYLLFQSPDSLNIADLSVVAQLNLFRVVLDNFELLLDQGLLVLYLHQVYFLIVFII